MMDYLHIPMAKPKSQPEHGKKPINQGSSGANGHQGIHIGRPMQQGPEPCLEKMTVDEQHGDGQKQLCQSGDQGILFPHKEPGCRQPHHRTHGNIHQRHKQDNGKNQPLFHLLLMSDSLVLAGHPLAAEAAFFQSCRLLFQRGCPIADLLHRLNNGIGLQFCFIVGNRHLIGQKADVYIFHSLQLGYAAGHIRLACGTGHPCDIVFFSFHAYPSSLQLFNQLHRLI